MLMLVVLYMLKVLPGVVISVIIVNHFEYDKG